jgi:hypothetical protein
MRPAVFLLPVERSYFWSEAAFLVACGAGVDTALHMAGLDTRTATLQCISMEAALHCILERSRISVHLGSRSCLHLSQVAPSKLQTCMGQLLFRLLTGASS